MLEDCLTTDASPRVTRNRVAEATTLARRAENLRAMRRCRGLTSTQFGKKCGILPNFLVEMENGQRSISIRTIDRLARGLGVESWRVLAELDR